MSRLISSEKAAQLSGVSLQRFHHVMALAGEVACWHAGKNKHFWKDDVVLPLMAARPRRTARKHQPSKWSRH